MINMKFLAITALPLSILLACGEKETSDTAAETTTTTEDTAEESTEDTAEESSEDTADSATDSSDDDSEAQVRVVHLSPDAPAVDVYADGSLVGVNDVSFPAGSDYLAVPAGEYTFEVAPTGTSHEEAVPGSLTANLEAGVSYTAIAHGYLNADNGANAFAITPFVTDRSEVTAGMFRLHFVHAAAADSFARVDIGNLTDPQSPSMLLPGIEYGETVTTELPINTAFVLGVDVNEDLVADAVFNIPDNLTGVVGLYAVNKTDGTPFLFAHLENGDTLQIDANPE